MNCWFGWHQEGGTPFLKTSSTGYRNWWRRCPRCNEDVFIRKQTFDDLLLENEIAHHDAPE